MVRYRSTHRGGEVIVPIVLFLESSTASFIVVATLSGLIVGSFLNVVIHRLPIMLEREWRSQCAEVSGDPIPVTEPYNPLRSPLIELATGVLSAWVAWHFGFGWAALGALLLTWMLIPLTVIDLEHQLLPDKLTLPLLWLGLVFNLGAGFTDIYSAVIGAVVGYLGLWCVFRGFRLLTSKEGMGYGDFKLLAALGAWLGWQMLPTIILLAAATGAVVGIGLILSRRLQQGVPIPFGPFLAAAGWIALLWGHQLNLKFFGQMVEINYVH